MNENWHFKSKKSKNVIYCIFYAINKFNIAKKKWKLAQPKCCMLTNKIKNADLHFSFILCYMDKNFKQKHMN